MTPDVVIVGAGPAGLRAAAGLAAAGVGEVLVLERDREAGGIPRHSRHTGFGVRDLGRFVDGPRYASLLRERAAEAGATILTEAMATGWAGPRALDVTAPAGRLRVEAAAVVLATGARERPRAARLIPGDRSAGVYTTGQLQSAVHLGENAIGGRAVVVGADAVSLSAVLTLRGAGCRTVLMTTEHPRRLATAAARAALRTPIAYRTRVVAVHGRPRVEAVEVEDLVTGRRRTVACDTVVLTADWVPDNELSRLAGLAPAPGSRAPLVDTALRTSVPGVFAAGNLLHPVDTADVAALDGAAVVPSVLSYLDGQAAAPDGVELRAEAPFRWVAPGLLRPGDPLPPRSRLLLWPESPVAAPIVVLRQDGREIAARRIWRPAAPGRIFRVPASLLHAADRTGGPVTVGLSLK